MLNQYHLNDGIDNDNTHLRDAIDKRKQRILAETESIRRSIKENNYYRMVDRFEKYFDNYIKDLLQHLSD